MSLGSLMVFFLWLFIIFIIAKLIFDTIMGTKLGEVIGWARSRTRPFKDVEATDHYTLMKEMDDSARSSIPYYMRGGRLYLEPDDPHFYTTSPAGRHSLGKLRGMAHLDLMTYIFYRPAWKLKKRRIVVPPFLVKSSLSSRNLMIEGVSLKKFSLDYYHPVPSPTSQRLVFYPFKDDPDGGKMLPITMEWMMEYVRRCYNVLMDHHTDFLQKDQGAYMVRKAGSDPQVWRMAQQGILLTKAEASDDREEGGII